MTDSVIQRAQSLIDSFADFSKEGRDPSSWMQNAYDLAMSIVVANAEGGQAGTHAYEMLATYAKADLNTSESLIQMVAATVLYKLIEEEGGGRSNVSFSPKDMDDMFANFEIDAKRDGMLTVVRIKPRDPEKHAVADVGQMGEQTQATFKRLLVQDEDTAKAKPQAEAKVHDRPVWAIRYYAGDVFHLGRFNDRADAERNLPSYFTEGLADPIIENRFCLHPNCPADHCNQAEVTSGT